MWVQYVSLIGILETEIWGATVRKEFVEDLGLEMESGEISLAQRQSLNCVTKGIEMIWAWNVQKTKGCRK